LFLAAAVTCCGESAPAPVAFASGGERAHDFVVRLATSDPPVAELVACVDDVDVSVATREWTLADQEASRESGRTESTLEPLASHCADDVLWVVYRTGGGRPPTTPPGGMGLLYVAAVALSPGAEDVSVKYVSRDPHPHSWSRAEIRAIDTPGAVSIHWAMTAETVAHTAVARVVDGKIELFELEAETR